MKNTISKETSAERQKYWLCRKYAHYVLTTEFTENTENENSYSSPCTLWLHLPTVEIVA